MDTLSHAVGDDDDGDDDINRNYDSDEIDDSYSFDDSEGYNEDDYDDNGDYGVVMMMTTAFRQIPTMTKSHHGGNMSLIGEVGFCHGIFPPLIII